MTKHEVVRAEMAVRKAIARAVNMVTANPGKVAELVEDVMRTLSAFDQRRFTHAWLDAVEAGVAFPGKPPTNPEIALAEAHARGVETRRKRAKEKT